MKNSSAMIIIPREKPVIQNLNSYYIDINKLLEHYQGQLGSGGLHFKSPVAEGVIFFDEETIINGTFKTEEGIIKSKAAIDRLLEALSQNNFSIAVYKIDPARVYFWASLQNAEEYYKNLSTEFTDLDGLIKKMSSEKLTGYIDVSIQGTRESGLLFFDNGAIIGCSCTWENQDINHSVKNQELLIRKSKELGGVFSVSRIVLDTSEASSMPSKEVQNSRKPTLIMIQDFLLVFEQSVKGNKKIKADFNTLLKRKFVDKADQYDFLDPFAAEFHYADGQVEFTGKADDRKLAKGVVESVYELAEELDMLSQFRMDLASWTEKYQREIERFELK